MLGILKSFKKILVVEDDSILRKTLTEALTDEGYKVLEARKGSEVLPLAFSERPHLIVLDLMLPDQNGMSILEELRIDEWGANVPVVIISNLRSGDSLLEQAEKYGVKDYIEKSEFSLGDVVGRIRAAL